MSTTSSTLKALSGSLAVVVGFIAVTMGGSAILANTPSPRAEVERILDAQHAEVKSLYERGASPREVNQVLLRYELEAVPHLLELSLEEQQTISDRIERRAAELWGLEPARS